MTSGVGRGTSGRREWPSWAIACLVLAAAILLFNTVNVLTELDERTRMGRPIPWWEPVVWEGTSGIVLLALAWLPMWMVERFDPAGPRPLRSLGAHLLASLPFSVAHVVLMAALREGAYALIGEDYRFGALTDTLLYEYRKDLLSYALFAATFWVVRRLGRRREAAPVPAPAGTGLFAIDEGQRLIRVPPADILGVRSSGNYVEFLLVGGRRPLMRATLAGIEAKLAEAGFVRTHRSWLVNPAHVVEAVAEGSGDYSLRLGDGSEIPLSRRYRPALAAIRPKRSGET